MKELRILLNKVENCAEVSLIYGDKLLAIDVRSKDNILVTNHFLSHLQGAIANLILEEIEGGQMKTKEEIKKEIDDMSKDLKVMEDTYNITGTEWQKDAIFCQKQVIKALEWCIG